MSYKVAVVGGGAAGMMCTATLCELNNKLEIVLLEKNDTLGKKVMISGGGRCNLTTGINDVKEVLTKYPRGNKFLSSSIYNFTPLDARTWFENHGIELVTENDLRVFPKSNKGEDVIFAFEKIFNRPNVQVNLKYSVQKIGKNENGFIIQIKDKKPIVVDFVVLTLGGQAYRKTGSTGDGYSFAESLGHTITSLAPSLNSFITSEKWPRRLAGVSFQNAKLSVKDSIKASFTGPFLFTHSGITGPAVFALSSLVATEPYGTATPLKLIIDLFPDFTPAELSNKITTSLKENPKKILKNILSQIVPQSAAIIAGEITEVNLDQQNASVSKNEIIKITSWLKDVQLSVTGRSRGEEFVTAGGVNTAEIDPKTMESKVCKNLFFAGEIMNIDGFTGGFNLHAAWATGRAAAVGILEKINSN